MSQLPSHIQDLRAIALRLKSSGWGRSSKTPLPFCLVWFSDEHDPLLLQKLERLPTVKNNQIAFIFRHYNTPNRVPLGRRFQQMCQARHIDFLWALDQQGVPPLPFDGIHLPERCQQEIKNIRRQIPDKIISTSCHSIQSVHDAEVAMADLAFLSPVFATRSHPQARPISIADFQKACRNVDMPVFALGGINLKTLPLLTNSGAQGIGAISAFTTGSSGRNNR